MAKHIIVGNGNEDRTNPVRKIDLGQFRYQIEKYKKEDVEHVLYKLQYAGKYIYIKGKTLAGSLIILTDTLNSFNPESSRFKGHLYTHLYTHLIDNPGGRIRIEVILAAETEDQFYELLKQEQKCLDSARYDQNCLNNQTEAYIPLWNEKSGKYGWIPKTAVMNFNRYLSSQERKDFLKQYKK